MKYLKRFNESNVRLVLDQSIIEECKDILLELEDIGIETNIQYHLGIHYSYIKFFFNREQEFNYSDIEDVVERLNSYLSEFGLHSDKPEIEKTMIMNPTTFEPHVRTKCELFFDSN
jgi:hypothetical protein